MPKYHVLVKSFINNTIAEAGEVVEYDGKPGSNLELVAETKPTNTKNGKGKPQDEGKDLV
jgi:hypothetical protein